MPDPRRRHAAPGGPARARNAAAGAEYGGRGACAGRDHAPRAERGGVLRARVPPSGAAHPRPAGDARCRARAAGGALLPVCAGLQRPAECDLRGRLPARSRARAGRCPALLQCFRPTIRAARRPGGTTRSSTRHCHRTFPSSPSRPAGWKGPPIPLRTGGDSGRRAANPVSSVSIRCRPPVLIERGWTGRSIGRWTFCDCPPRV